MSTQLQCLSSPIINATESTRAVLAIDITAVALLKLMMRAENTDQASTGANTAAPELVSRRAEPLAINDHCDPALSLTPYLEEQLKTIVDAVFNRVNGDFYRAYKGLTHGQMAEIVLSRSDLRPLAYRALMYEGPAADRPFAPRFAASLLLLQKYWYCEFLQQYKDVSGCLSAYSLSRGSR